jgi:hypothetical protein
VLLVLLVLLMDCNVCGKQENCLRGSDESLRKDGDERGHVQQLGKRMGCDQGRYSHVSWFHCRSDSRRRTKRETYFSVTAFWDAAVPMTSIDIPNCPKKKEFEIVCILI